MPELEVDTTTVFDTFSFELLVAALFTFVPVATAGAASISGTIMEASSAGGSGFSGFLDEDVGTFAGFAIAAFVREDDGVGVITFGTGVF